MPLIRGHTSGRQSPKDRLQNGLPDQRSTVDAPPTRDDLFEALSNRRRRYAIHYLQQHEGEGSVDLSDVSTQVAAWELGADPSEINYSDRKNVHTALYQFHAPKLDAIGLLTFDKRGGVLELTRYGENLWIDLEMADHAQMKPRYSMTLMAFFGVGITVAFYLLSLSTGRMVVGGVLILVSLFVGFWCGLRRAEQGQKQIVKDHPPPPIPEKSAKSDRETELE